MSGTGDQAAELRKREEAEFHDRLRGAQLLDDPREYERLTSNKRFYSIDRVSSKFIEDWLVERCRGKRVLDYCCGNGKYSFVVAQHGGSAVGIDISEVSIENCRREAAKQGVEDRTDFRVMDAEQMAFPDNSFSYACVAGVLHHLDLPRAYAELARVIEPGGAVVSLEALGHNPVINAYRRRTPHLRTSWEAQHIIRMKDLKLARRYFRHVDLRFFHLATLAAVPFRRTPLFRLLLRALEAIDTLLLRIPWIREQAWMVGFVLSGPVKPGTGSVSTPPHRD
jgi:ubiquinone/menaquinone biosynthesis C-methylase UbiE